MPAKHLDLKQLDASEGRKTARVKTEVRVCLRAVGGHEPSVMSMTGSRMAKRTATPRAVADITEAVPHLIRLPQGHAWVDYDREVDVLYVSLKRPQRATDTVDHDGILLRNGGKELVGVTVLNASRRTKNGRRKW